MDPEERARIGLDPDPAAAIPVVVELNLRHHLGLEEAAERFRAHYHRTLGDRPPPDRVADTYYRCELTQDEILRLVAADQDQPDPGRRLIYRVWPDFPIHPLIDVSCATVKADAARRSFDATGRGITWAVLDSGIDADHHHFRRYQTLQGEVASLHPTSPARATPAWATPWWTGSATAPTWPGSSPAACRPACPVAATCAWSSGSSTRPTPTSPGSRTARSAGPRCWPGSPGRPSWSA
jgi:hypothetical protein